MIVYILVFAAVLMGVYCVVRLAQNVGDEKAELAKKNNEERVYANPMNRYVSDQMLVQIRLMVTMFLAAGFAGILILCEIDYLVWLPLSTVVGAFGFMLPYWYFSMKVRKRRLLFESRILDFTLGMTNGLRAGQALSQSIEFVTKSLDGPIREELMVALREYRLGVDLPEALERMYNRMPCEDLRILVSAIRLTQQSGGSLADVLAKMTDMIRKRTEFQEKLRTMTAQGRFEAIAIASAPLAAFGILYFMDKDLMAPMLHTTVGWTAIGAVFVLVGIGFYFINKIVTIEV